MTITWYGNLCVGVSSKGPLGERSLLLFPERKTTRARVEQRMHIALGTGRWQGKGERWEGTGRYIEEPGEYEFSGFHIRGIPVRTGTPEKGEEHLSPWETVFVVEQEGITLCHPGFLKKVPLADEELEQVGSVDVIVLPVGGKEVLKPQDALILQQQLEPRLVIPISYKTPRSPEFLPLEQFLKESGFSKKEARAKLSIKKKELPLEDTELVMLEAQ